MKYFPEKRNRTVNAISFRRGTITITRNVRHRRSQQQNPKLPEIFPLKKKKMKEFYRKGTADGWVMRSFPL